MSRLPRIDLAGIPQHVIQRGNNRQACFFFNVDYRTYLDSLTRAAKKYGCFIHAYVLMTNHVHLLVTGTQAGAVSGMMQSLGRRYVGYVNSTYQRTGTLWEGRFKSSLVESERYLLACYRYIELNPVRAAMVSAPGEYGWSSYGCNAMGLYDDVVTPHECYLSLGNSDKKRLSSYLALFQPTIDNEDILTIRKHVNQGRVLGTERFRDYVAKTLNRRVRLTVPGRPKKVL